VLVSFNRHRSWRTDPSDGEGKVMVSSKPLRFDPIDEARRQWAGHGWDDSAFGMAVVTSIFRAQQIYLARIDAVLRPLGLTFARFEVMTLLNFTRSGSLPMSKIGSRLQVHPTSVTSCVDRLELQGFVRRIRHATDRRTTLVEILPEGRSILTTSTEALNRDVFANLGVSSADADQLFFILRGLRLSEGDFE
jgi:DNA-binding MarR family transcriptional regulator